MIQHEDSQCIGHEPCPACGSRDNLGRYSDGHGYCFGCGHYDAGAGAAVVVAKRVSGSEFLQGEVQALPSRGLNERTCQKYGYRVGQDNGHPVQIADYRDMDGQLVAQKIKGKKDGKKTFRTVGDGRDMPLFGAHLWQAGGKRVIVTEGEVDCLSVAQVLGLSWPVVSVPNGAQSAKKALQRNLEWLESFDQVVLCFDSDEPGREAAAECSTLFSPGRCAVCELPLKDANEMLVAGETKALTTAIYQARIYRPEGIISGQDLWTALSERSEPGVPYFMPKLTEMTTGQRKGTLVTWVAGTSVGKSTLCAKVLYDFAYGGDELANVGVIALEEGVARTAHRFLSLHLGQLTHIPGNTDEPSLRAAFDATLGRGNVHVLDGFGSVGIDDVLAKIRFLAKGLDCKVILLDHITGLASGIAMEVDERKALDACVTKLRSIVEETGITLHMVSHLRRLHSDEGHEQGAQIGLQHIRGSHGIAQWSDDIVALERDTQAEEEARCVTRVRVLKARQTGFSGVAGYFSYDPKTGAIAECAAPEVFEAEDGGRDF